MAILLYGTEVWGLFHCDELEGIHCMTMKNLLRLPINTSGYIVRLETGTNSLVIDIMQRTYGWWSKLQSLPDSRYPKMCYNKLNEMIKKKDKISRSNWANVLRERLFVAELGHIWDSGSTEVAKNCTEEVLAHILAIHRNIDRERLLTSTIAAGIIG